MRLPRKGDVFEAANAAKKHPEQIEEKFRPASYPFCSFSTDSSDLRVWERPTRTRSIQVCYSIKFGLWAVRKVADRTSGFHWQSPGRLIETYWSLPYSDEL